MDNLTCANPGCENNVPRSTHNQKYCSPECCRTATNERIKAQYHANKARLRGAERRCNCGNLLSRYNSGKICSQCEAKKSAKTKLEILEHFGVNFASVKA